MISKDDVQYVAGLARIHLRDDEIDSLTADLEKILQYVDKLSALDTNDVEPTSHVLPLKNVHREDKVRPSFTQEEAMKFSVEQHEGSYKVPKVIE